MKKKYLMPKVVLYNDLINHEKILNIVKKSESENSDGKYYFDKWKSWLETGKSNHIKSHLGNFKDGLYIPNNDALNLEVNPNSWLIKNDENNLDISRYKDYPEKVELHHHENKKEQYIKEYNLLKNNDEAIEQRELLSEIYSAYKKIIIDYIKDWDWSEDGCWSIVSDWDISNKNWFPGQLSLLKYTKSTDIYGSNMAMNYHTDSPQ